MENILNIAGTVSNSIVDGPGLRYVVFVQGCPHHCKGCHNPQTWPFEQNKFVNINTIYNEIVDDPLIDGVTFSGGEPFAQAKTLSKLGRMLKKKNYNIITYTGYTYEFLTKTESPYVDMLLDVTDVLIDGPFIESQKSLELKYKGSKNQRIIDVHGSMIVGRPIEKVFD